MNNPAVFIICGTYIMLALIMNQKTAKYLLAGYNTMTEQQRKDFNIGGFIRVFRLTFFIGGFGMLVVWYALSYAGYANYANIMVIFLPLVIVVFVVVAGQRFYRVRNNKGNRKKMILVYGILGACAVFLISLLYFGMKDNKLDVSGDSIIISGMYGEKIPVTSVTKVEITDKLPSLAARTNGFAFNKHLKGYFRTKKGGTVKLFVDAGMHKYLKISSPLMDYYWNSGSENMNNIYNEIKNRIQ